MDVLIIGGNRFLGYFLVWRLLAGGHKVTVLNRGTMPDPFGARVERVVADRKTPNFSRLLEGRSFDGVVDFAAYDPEDIDDVLAAFPQGRIRRYVFVSTGQVYLVRRPCPLPSKETDYDGLLIAAPSDPSDREQWDYGMKKRACEDRLVSAWERSGFPSTRIRIPMVNGERDYYRRIESYLVRILDGGPLLVPDGGAHPVRHVYGLDVVKTIASLIEGRVGVGDAGIGEAYNLAQEELPTLVELLAMLAEFLGAPARVVSIPRAALESSGLKPTDVSPFSGRWMSFISPDKAKAELGFRHTDLGVYLDKIVTSYLAFPRASPPENYAFRETELRLARAAAATSLL